MWIEQVVVGLELCPFAAQPLLEDRVRLALCEAVDLEDILQALMEEVSWLEAADGPQTTLLVLSRGVSDFDRFLDLVAAAEDLLVAAGQDRCFQLAHFHPDYCFEGTEPADPSNLTNRSPYPVLHLLRRRDVAQAIRSHPEPEQIPAKNIETMRSLGAEGLRALLEKSGLEPEV